VNPNQKGACVRLDPAPAPTSQRPPVRLLGAADSTATAQAELALAVWRLHRPPGSAGFPRELARAAIRHYTDPGQLVLANRSDLRAEAARLGRRALPLAPAGDQLAACDDDVVHLREQEATLVLAVARADDVVHLREQEATLVLAVARADDDERVATRLSEPRPGGFLALAPAPRVQPGLGALVRVCQRSGLQYWQHVVALAPTPAQTPQHSRPSATARLHRDLLVFRRPLHAAAGEAAAAA
jgi:hypothetical protein